MIAYGRLIPDADIDYYVSIDPFKVGKQQAEVQMDALEKAGGRTRTSCMINGAPTDSNAKPYKDGATKVLKKRGREDREELRHARLEPGQGPAGDGELDHRSGQ